MTDFAALMANDAREHGGQRGQDARSAGARPSPADNSAPSRFGAAASILDRLDTRPLEVRLRRRPWWKFW